MFSKSEKATWSEKDPRSVRSRQALRTAFRELVEVKTIDDITIRDVTNRSGIGYTTFFRHYSDKEDISREIITEEITNAITNSSTGFRNYDFFAAYSGMCHYIERNAKLWKNLLTGASADIFKKLFYNLATVAAESRPATNGRLPMELVVIVSVGVVLDVVTWWLRQPLPIAADQVAEMLAYIVEPLSRDNAEARTLGTNLSIAKLLR